MVRLRIACLTALLSVSLGCPDRPANVALEEKREPQTAPSATTAAPVGSGATGESEYEWVGKSKGVTLAVAESRGLDKARVAHVAEGLVEAFSACALERKVPREGALRVVLGVGANGQVEGFNLTVSEAARGLALICLVAPAKAQSFGATTQGAQSAGLALEAVWDLPAPL
jgi:hypothetical protein